MWSRSSLGTAPVLNTVILMLFLVAWLYTEITEHDEREAWRKQSVQELEEFKAFLLEGERFTLLDGMDLSNRVAEIEKRLDAEE